MAAASEGKRLVPSHHPYKKRIIWFYGFGMFLDDYSLCRAKNAVDSLLKEQLKPRRLLFYSSRDDQNRKRLEAAVQKVIPESKIELFKRLAELRERLRMPIEPDSFAVLSVFSR